MSRRSGFCFQFRTSASESLSRLHAAAVTERDGSLLVQTTLLWLGVNIAALLFDRGRWVATRNGAVESLCLLATLLLLVSVPAVRAFVKGLPRVHGLFTATTVAVLLFGQLIGMSPLRTFPIIPWRMFGSDTVTIQPFTFFEFAGHTHDGRSVTVTPDRLFPSLKNQRMAIGLHKLIDRTLNERSPADSRRADERRLREVLAAIGRSYSARNPETPLRSLVVWVCVYDPAVSPAEARISRRHALTVDLGVSAP